MTANGDLIIPRNYDNLIMSIGQLYFPTYIKVILDSQSSEELSFFIKRYDELRNPNEEWKYKCILGALVILKNRKNVNIDVFKCLLDYYFNYLEKTGNLKFGLKLLIDFSIIPAINKILFDRLLKYCKSYILRHKFEYAIKATFLDSPELFESFLTEKDLKSRYIGESIIYVARKNKKIRVVDFMTKIRKFVREFYDKNKKIRSRIL